MDHLPRFHRRKKDVAAPTLITSDLSGKTTPPQPDVLPSSPMRPFQKKLNPLRVFHRSSGKRARDSPPASLPHSPAAVPVLAVDGADDRPVSPLSLKMDLSGDDGRKQARPLRMPAFLDQTEQEIENKFMELVWRERNRLLQSVNNPSPDFRWARVTGPHLKSLDRYMNVQPWHNNRIKLQVPDGHVDYVNASPIVLAPAAHPTASAPPREPDRYIAMQGPKQSSVDHVWRMVVEQLENPGVIVMLTETHEGHIEKCYPYFPRSKEDPPLEINERDEFGDGFRATVRCEGMEETPAGDAIELRKLVVTVHSRPKAGTTIQPVPGTPERVEEEEKDADDDVKMKSPSKSPVKPTAPITPNQPSVFKNKNNDDQQTSTSFPTSTSTTTENNSTGPESSPEPEERIVWHFLYKKWPDFGVPSLADLDSFFTLMRLSRAKNSPSTSSSDAPHGPASGPILTLESESVAKPGGPSPRIVHCSAGVGRSGTFIALEHLLGELERGVLERWDDPSRFSRPSSGDGHAMNTDAAGAEGVTPISAGPTPISATSASGPTPTLTSAPPSASASASSPSTSSSAAASALGLDKGFASLGEDLIFETVDRLREQRRTMVQAESQYLFIYQVMRKLWVEKYGERMGRERSRGRGRGSRRGGEGGGDDGGDGEGVRGGDDGDARRSGTGEPAAKRLEVDPDPFVG